MIFSKLYLLSYYGYGSGDGDGSGSGSGTGSGNGDGYGNGYGDGYGVYLIKIFGEWFDCSGKIENSLCHNLPEHLHSKITKDFISKVDNLESLRSLREKIGIDKYIHLLGAKIICKQTDNQGYPMKLYRYDEQGEKVILLEVICPSTGRMYHLYPPWGRRCFSSWVGRNNTTIFRILNYETPYPSYREASNCGVLHGAGSMQKYQQS